MTSFGFTCPFQFSNLPQLLSTHVPGADAAGLVYHKVFSMDTNDWTQLHISIYAQSPEDVLLRAEEHAEQERNLSRMAEAFAHLTPTQAPVQKYLLLVLQLADFLLRLSLFSLQ